jgi:hypothetical protein
MAIQIPVSQAGRFVGRSIFFYIKLGLVSLFVIYLFVHAILLGIQHRDITVTILELGKEFISPLEKAQETSFLILDGKAGVMDYWNLYYNIFWIFLWIRLLLILWGWTPVSNESNKFDNLLLAFLSFLVIQALYLLIQTILIGDGNISRVNIVWRAWIDISKALMYSITQQRYELRVWRIFSESKLNNTCTDSTCVI